MVTREQLIEKIRRLPEDKLKELAVLVACIEGKEAGKEPEGLAECDMGDYLHQLVEYEDMLASGKIKWK